MAFLSLSLRPAVPLLCSLPPFLRISTASAVAFPSRKSTVAKTFTKFFCSSLVPANRISVLGDLPRVLAVAQLSTEVTQASFQQSRPTTMAHVVRDRVQLTDLEERIFNILTAVLEKFDLKTQLRVAGGWVRDKVQYISSAIHFIGMELYFMCILAFIIFNNFHDSMSALKLVCNSLQLLGKDSTDIDIALDDMLGREFCEKVNEYLASLGEETHSVGVIMR